MKHDFTVQLSIELKAVASGTSPIFYIDKIVRRTQPLTCLDITILSNPITVHCTFGSMLTTTFDGGDDGLNYLLKFAQILSFITIVLNTVDFKVCGTERYKPPLFFIYKIHS